jgi:hypothetical protein
MGREYSPVMYVDRQLSDVKDIKSLERSVRGMGRGMKADESSVKVVGNVARMRFWWD